MNLHFSKPMVKTIAAICIVVLVITSACLAVFAVQSTTTQGTVTVDDSAHTVDVSKKPDVSAGTFRELYPDFTVLDSCGAVAGAKEPLRFCSLSKGDVLYKTTGVPANYSMNNWTMDSTS
ncbi:MAG TPA: hypothetical protein DDY70_04145, partial [Clostridiales bacterium]|nr:hypothetical protein [Clostridiales bacterium]